MILHQGPADSAQGSCCHVINDSPAPRGCNGSVRRSCGEKDDTVMILPAVISIGFVVAVVTGVVQQSTRMQ